jgi:hypothetical protein
MNTICPDLSARLGWQFPASDKTCGDCIEALIGVWFHCEDGWAPYTDDWRPTAICVTLDRAAMCWENMSYRAYRIFRVLDWYRITRVLGQSAGLRAFSNTEEMIIQDAIHCAGSYYRTTSQWQHAVTTSPRDRNVPQPTRLMSQPSHTTEGRPGISDDTSQQSCDSKPPIPYDWAEQLGCDSSDYPQGFSTEDGDLGDMYY